MLRKQSCPVCGADNTTVFLRREGVPVHQHLLLKRRQDAVETGRGTLEIAVCEECGFAFNQAFDAAKLHYGDQYNNSQLHSPAFRNHVDCLKSSLLAEAVVPGSRIVEVGCGNGAFLEELIQASQSTIGIGFDPSYVGQTHKLDGRLEFHACYYDSACAVDQAGVVISRHVIEHVPDPVNMLLTIRRALAGSPDAKVFFETPCLEWILRHQVVWDFFYEHCSYFTAESLTTAFEAAGFEVMQVQRVFSGQYLWLEAKPGVASASPARRPGRIPQLAAEFAQAQDQQHQRWQAQVAKLSRQGPLAIWGAGAKGVTFLNLIDPDQCIAHCVVDANPQKQGGFLPGTGHPIVGYQHLKGLGIHSALLLNPNYRAEIQALIHQECPGIALIDLMDPA